MPGQVAWAHERWPSTHYRTAKALAGARPHRQTIRLTRACSFRGTVRVSDRRGQHQLASLAFSLAGLNVTSSIKQRALIDWSLAPASKERAAASDSTNHIPGVHQFIHKPALAKLAHEIEKNWSFVAPGCMTADECKHAARRAMEITGRAQSKWVSKSIHHKDVELTHPEIAEGSARKMLTQMRIESPLLIDQTQFDMGMYVLLRPEKNQVSVSVESFEDVLIRFCLKPYDPDDFSDPDTWVVGKKYRQPHEVASLSPLLAGSNTSESAIRTYLRKLNLSPENVWSQMHQIISAVVEASAPNIRLERGVFELVRFDFIVDATGKVWLIEANSSPNLIPKTPRQHARLQRMIEEVTC